MVFQLAVVTAQFICQPFELELQVSEDEAEYEDRVVMTDEEGRTRHVSILDPLLPMFHTSNFHTSSYFLHILMTDEVGRTLCRTRHDSIPNPFTTLFIFCLCGFFILLQTVFIFL